MGLGGGSLSKYCFHKFPSARVTTVEIDDRVIALREQFFIPPESERFRIVHADAAEYLSDKVGVADVILLDGFDAFGLPASLSSQSFYDACHAALQDEGVLVANLLNSDPRLATHLDRIRRACDGKLFRTMARREGNTIAIGIKQATVPGGLTSTPARKPSRNRWGSTCTGMSKKWNVITGQSPFRDTPHPTHWPLNKTSDGKGDNADGTSAGRPLRAAGGRGLAGRWGAGSREPAPHTRGGAWSVSGSAPYSACFCADWA